MVWEHRLYPYSTGIISGLVAGIVIWIVILIFTFVILTILNPQDIQSLYLVFVGEFVLSMFIGLKYFWRRK